MHGPINVKSPNNTTKWQMGFNSAFKGLIHETHLDVVHEDFNKDYDAVADGKDLMSNSHWVWYIHENS
jgi:hypothetical protein